MAAHPQCCELTQVFSPYYLPTVHRSLTNLDCPVVVQWMRCNERAQRKPRAMSGTPLPRRCIGQCSALEDPLLGRGSHHAATSERWSALWIWSTCNHSVRMAIGSRRIPPGDTTSHSSCSSGLTVIFVGSASTPPQNSGLTVIPGEGAAMKDEGSQESVLKPQFSLAPSNQFF